MPRINRLYVALLFIVASDKILYLIQSGANNDPAPLFALNVAILSARENFDKRQAIRDTWLRHADIANQLFHQHGLPFMVNVHFVLGNRPCLVHPLSREELYDCVPKSSFDTNFSFKALGSKPYSLFKLKPKQVKPHVGDQFYRGFSFRTYDSIVVRKLGVLSTLVDRTGPVSVVVLNAFTKDKVFSTTVSQTKQNTSDDNFYFADIELDLKGGSTFVILIEQEIYFYDNISVLLNLGPWGPVLKLLRSYYGLNDFNSKSFQSGDLFLVNFQFEIKDIDSLRQSRESYTKTWHTKQQIIHQKLVDESKTFNDLVFVRMVDVYRNLPHKLLLYFEKSLDANVNFTHLLKTDDDCYVNIFLAIELLLRHYSDQFTWFGNFRKNWAVNYYGKWADDSYTSPIYPHFACGSGYILTRDLVEWLNANRHHLHRYQGEDVSMGIWLAAIVPKMVQDRRWMCGEEEAHIDGHHKFLSAPQFTPEAMVRTYSSWSKFTSQARDHIVDGMH